MEEVKQAKLGVGVQGGADAVSVDGGRVELDGFADVRGEDGVGVGKRRRWMGDLVFDPEEGEELAETLFDDGVEGWVIVEAEKHVGDFVGEDGAGEQAGEAGEDEDGGDFLRLRTRDASLDHLETSAEYVKDG